MIVTENRIIYFSGFLSQLKSCNMVNWQPRSIRTELSADEQNLEISWKPARHYYRYKYKIYVMVPNTGRQEVYCGKYTNCTIAVRRLEGFYGVNNININNPVKFQIVTFEAGFENKPVQFNWPIAI